jgi:type IV pilus assembly protein PilF
LLSLSRLLLLISAILVLSACVTSNTHTSTVDTQKAHDAHVNLGLTYLGQDNREASRRHFKKALSFDSDSAQAHAGMGLLYQLTGETELAEQSFLRALKEDSQLTEARVNYGRFLYQQKRYKEAVTEFAKATEDLSYKKRATALSYLAQTLSQLGDNDKAKAKFEHAHNINNKLALPLIELAEIYFDEKDYAKSKSFLDQYVGLAGRDPKSLWLGIRIERIFGNKDKEASYALALKNLHPYSGEYLLYKKSLNQ